MHEEDTESAFTGSKDCITEGGWIMDSGATTHMTFQKELLHNYREFSTPEKVKLSDGRVVNALGSGSIRLSMHFKVSNSKPAMMYDVLLSSVIQNAG